MFIRKYTQEQIDALRLVAAACAMRDLSLSSHCLDCTQKKAFDSCVQLGGDYLSLMMATGEKTYPRPDTVNDDRDFRRVFPMFRTFAPYNSILN